MIKTHHHIPEVATPTNPLTVVWIPVTVSLRSPTTARTLWASASTVGTARPKTRGVTSAATP